MAQLAIEGHSKRGTEVIELLEMLGGVNTHNLYGYKNYAYYIIDSDKEIKGGLYMYGDEDLLTFTLEEFLEKFPYKVGDKVMTDDGDKANIVGMVWDNDINDVFYETHICNEVFKYPKELLQPYKEETMEKENKSVFDANAQCCDIMNHLIKEETIWDLPDGYEFQDKDGNIINTSVIRLVKKRPQYPKTYEECCEVLIPDCVEFNVILNGYNGELLEKLGQLLICRDAYWKIAGEQMGLGEPWKPDWLNVEQDKFVLYTHDDVICLNRFVLGHNVLAFPTAEMRDAFLENFKELINEIKELL